MNIAGQISAPNIQYDIDINFDVGILYSPNGSGKSKLLQSMHTTDENELEISIIPPERGGSLEVNMSTVQQERNKAESLQQKRKNQVKDYRQRAIAQISIYTNELADASRTKPLKSEFPYIERKLEELFPKYIFDVSAADGIKVNIVSDEDVVPLSLNSLSTSESDVICLAIDILCRAIIYKLRGGKSNMLILVDEPTAYMNIDTTARFAQFILEISASHKVKFLIATNDHEFISSLDFYKNRRKISIITLTSSGITEQKRLHLDHSDNIISGFVTQGRFLSKIPVFVEGSDDQYVWQRASRLPGGPSIIAVDVGGGREVKPTLDDLETLAAAFEEKKLMALGITDCDIPINFENEKRTVTKGYNLSCHELENLYLTDTALKILGSNWEKVKKQVQGNKSLEPLTKLTFSRKDADIKNIINFISEEVDPLKRDWREIVAKALVNGRGEDEDIREWVGKELSGLLYQDNGQLKDDRR